MKKVILASSSPRRATLLSQIGLKFKIVPSNYTEDMTLRLSPKELVKKLSLGKTMAVARHHKNSIIIGADTFIVFRGKVLGKPKNPNDARRMLRMLSGKTNSVITGYSIIDTGTNKILSRAVETKIKMRKFSDKEINAYIRTKEPLDKAGAYAVQGIGGNLIEKIDGDFFGVIGLPLFEIIGDLRKFGVRVLS